MKKILLFLVAFTILFAIGCNSAKETKQGEETINFKNADVVEGNEAYEVLEKDGYYAIHFYDEEGNVSDSFGPVNQCPDTELLNDSVLKVINTTQEVSWYYDLENNVMSEIFMGVDAEKGSLVAIIDEDIVIVCDMFDSEKVMEITEFSGTLDYISEPIISVEFNEDASEVSVTYLDDSSSEVTDVIAIEF